MLMQNRLLPVILLAFILLADVAHSQTTVKLDSIQVTASRITSTVSESGKHVSVLTQADIRQMPVSSVDELIRTLSGININSRQGFGVQADVGIRGSTYSQVLFMLDNVPLNDPLTAHFNTNIPVSLSEIGQVELIRGPASASYGADAVGGVVHIKTKMYMEREVQRPDDTVTYAVADFAAGQNNLISGDVAVEMQRNRLRLSASLRTIQSDGERLSNPGFDAGASDQEFYDNYFEMTSFTSSLSYRLAENWSFYLRGGLDDRDFSARYFYTRSEFDESTEQINSRWLLSALTRDSGNHRTELNVSWRNVNDDFDFNSRIGIPVNEHTTDLFFMNLSHQVTTGRIGAGSSRLMGGVQLTNKQIASTDRGDHDELMGGIYLIAQLNPVERLNMTASSRIQFDTRGRAELLPQLSTSYDLGSVILRGSAGRAIRVGDFTERFISSQIPDLTPGRNIGNPDLAPERSYSFDLGADWNPLEQTQLSATGFYRTSSNLIDYVLTNSDQIENADNLRPGENYFYTQNISSAQTSGLELQASQQFRLANNRMAGLEAGYTYIRTTADTGEVSKYIANHPSHQLNLGLRISFDRFLIYSQSSYRMRAADTADIIGAAVPDSYFVTNLNIEYSVLNRAVIYARALNLTDTQYQEILGPPMPGRWMMGGVRLQIR
ncbi:MAG: TonB-dependent receptor [Balneolaceae bacterium]|nr:MAG: TonB-dependent receptor [Balneolaceae bacterium]